MSIEARTLAGLINDLDDSAEKATDQKVYDEGLQAYQHIIRQIRFILPRGLKLVPDYLDEHGRYIYEKYFKKKIEEEIKKGGK